jgi:hypothetical protein
MAELGAIFEGSAATAYAGLVAPTLRFILRKKRSINLIECLAREERAFRKSLPGQHVAAPA